jgi:valyl-tRNA synthetase
VVFEKSLEASGDSRFNHTRDELYQMTWDFVAENRGNMEMQLRALGASCDWNAQVFTLDRAVTDVIFTTFKKLWDDGLIYRGERLVNYCTYHDTSFADIEVEYQNEQGKLWYIDYPLVDGQGSVTVATTRPETILGDEAVAVNPNDKRYAKLVGKMLALPLVGKSIPIIADEAVQSDFGTGAVKVTPAHDPTDFDIGQRHGLPLTSVIGYDGLMIPPAPEEFVGLDVETARRQVVEQLEHLGLISKIEDYEHQVPHCYKCGRVIQPLIKDQWFISVQPLAKKAIAAIKSGKIKFTPQQKAEELIRYYQELKDWNISRQIPWGIPIPAFRRVGDSDAPEWIFDTRVDQEFIEVNGATYQRDEDTFDTWFSSGQWPYVVTRGDLERFYPTTVMETGFDILRAWVARMIMLGLYISDDVPFEQVYLHGLVNDEHNQKMSKSKGNVINPMTIVDEYGADALRLGIIANRSAALSQAFSPATVIAGRNFCNKLWNMARYIASRPPAPSLRAQRSNPAVATTAAEHWVFRQLDNARQQIEKLLADFRFAESYEVLYHVVWDDVADWYIEASKIVETSETVNASASPSVIASAAKQSSNKSGLPRQTSLARNDGALISVLQYVLKLAHPFAPFVTETIWQSLSDDVKPTTLLISQQWPEKLNYDHHQAADFDKIIDIVREIRRANIELGGGRRAVYSDDKFVGDNAEIIKFLARSGSVKTGQSGLKLNLPDHEIYLQASDAEIGKYQEKLAKTAAETKAKTAALEARLANKSYIKNAPPALVAETRAELAKLKP